MEHTSNHINLAVNTVRSMSVISSTRSAKLSFVPRKAHSFDKKTTSRGPISSWTDESVNDKCVEECLP